MPAPALPIVVAVVAVVPFPPFIDRHDLVLRNWRGERLVPRATVLKVQALGEETAKPLDYEEGESNPQNDAEAQG